MMTNVPEPHGTRAPVGAVCPDARISPLPISEMSPRPQCRYPLHHQLAGCGQGTLGVEPAERSRTFTTCSPMLDGWTDVFQVPGKRTTGTGAQTYAITGPGWKGTLPEGVKEYKSPTALVWILRRIYCTGHS